MKIYIAGKLNSDACGYIKNVHLMVNAGIAARKLGHSVFIPALDLLVGLIAGDYEYADYAGHNIEWLDVCDEIWVLPNSEESKGTQAEIKRAEELNKVVRYL